MKRFLCLWVLFLALLPPSIAQTKKISLDTVKITIAISKYQRFSFKLNHTDESGLSTIDWGDGDTSTVYGNDNQSSSHSYSKDTIIEIRIYGNKGRISTLSLSNYYDYGTVIHLDVSKSTALTSLNCSSNQLTSLDVSKNTVLTSLNCSRNQLTSLDVSKNTVLTDLNCSGNQLTSLDVSKNTALTSLTCDGNPLTSLDVSKNTALTSLNCSSNQLTSLDVSKNTALTDLGCSYNQLISLDLSKNTALTSLTCYGNPLTSLDVNGCPDLEIRLGNRYHMVQLNADRSLDLSTLPGMNVSKVSAVTGGYIEGNLLHFDADVVSYSYEIRSGESRSGFLLVAMHSGETRDTARIIWKVENSETKKLAFRGIQRGHYLVDWGDGNNPDTLFLGELENRTAVHTYTEKKDYTVLLYGVEGTDRLLKLSLADDRDYGYPDSAALDASGCTALTQIECTYPTLLYSLNVSGCTSLGQLSLQTYIDIKQPYSLSLDVSSCISLKSIGCGYYLLTSLDVSKNTALTSLTLYNSQLTSLDVSKNTALTELICSGLYYDDYNGSRHFERGRLKSLDVSKNTALTLLECSYNRIPLSTLYNIYSQHSYESFSAEGQGDSIVLLVGEELDLSSERRLGQGVSTYRMTDQNGSEIHASDMWEEKGFVFRFNEPYTYCLEIKNPAVENSSFTYYISVVGELPADYFSIQTRPNNTDWGTVAMTGNGRYKDGAEVTIIASAKTGYRFVNWTKEDGSVFATEAVHTFAVTENMDLTANFEEIPEEEESFAIGLLSNNPEWGLVSQLGTGSYKEDEEATIIATPNAGYRFVNWTKEDETVFSTEAVHTFKVKENLELMANFEKLSEEVESFTLSLSSNNPAWGNVFQSGEGRYEEGEEATVIAAANAGYRFVNWTKKDGSVFSTKAVHTFAVMENLELTANFEQGVGNENSMEDNFYVYSKGHTIYLSCGMGTIQVFDAAGTLVYNGQSTAIPVQHSGMYIVKVGERSFKTIVR